MSTISQLDKEFRSLLTKFQLFDLLDYAISYISVLLMGATGTIGILILTNTIDIGIFTFFILVWCTAVCIALRRTYLIDKVRKLKLAIVEFLKQHPDYLSTLDVK